MLEILSPCLAWDKILNCIFCCYLLRPQVLFLLYQTVEWRNVIVFVSLKCFCLLIILIVTSLCLRMCKNHLPAFRASNCPVLYVICYVLYVICYMLCVSVLLPIVMSFPEHDSFLLSRHCHFVTIVLSCSYLLVKNVCQIIRRLLFSGHLLKAVKFGVDSIYHSWNWFMCLTLKYLLD